MWAISSENDQKPTSRCIRVISSRPKPRSNSGTRAMRSTWYSSRFADTRPVSLPRVLSVSASNPRSDWMPAPATQSATTKRLVPQMTAVAARFHRVRRDRDARRPGWSTATAVRRAAREVMGRSSGHPSQRKPRFTPSQEPHSKRRGGEERAASPGKTDAATRVTARAAASVHRSGHAGEACGAVGVGAGVLRPRRVLAQRTRAARRRGVRVDDRLRPRGGTLLHPVLQGGEGVPSGDERAEAVAHAGNRVEAQERVDLLLPEVADDAVVQLDGV